MFFYSSHIFDMRTFESSQFFQLPECLLQCLDQHNINDGRQLNAGNLNGMN